MYKFKTDQGIMLISVLILITILMMLVTSMLIMATQNYNMAGMADKKAKALRAAQAGVEYALYQLNRDTTWSPSTDIYVDMHFSNGETARLISSSSRNNLKGDTKVVTTPPYSAEILSEGSYKGQKVKMRAIFVRDDVSQFPVESEGDLCINYQSVRDNKNISGKNNSPGRIHSNKNMLIYDGYSGPTVDLNNGFTSSVGDLAYSKYYGSSIPPFDYKEHVTPVEIADINIGNVISSHKAGCYATPGNKYYLVGYFEYNYIGPGDPGNYCVPHEGPNSVAPQTIPGIDYWDQTSDDQVYSYPYKFGMASFTESSCKNFMNNYRELQSIGPDTVTPYAEPPHNVNPSRNLYDYYPDVTFGELYSPECNNMMNSLGVTYTAQLDNGITVVTMTLNDNTYCPNSVGVFDTLRFDCYREGNGDIGDARMISYIKPKVKLNMNNKNIYADGEVSLPSIDQGTVVTNDSVYLSCAYDGDMTVLAENNIVMCVKDPTPDVQFEPNSTITLSGLLYAKDHIFLSTLYWPQMDYNQDFVFKGSMAAKNKTSVNNPYPRITNWYNDNETTSNISIDPGLAHGVTLIHANNGVHSLVQGRKADFRVRKAVCTIVN